MSQISNLWRQHKFKILLLLLTPFPGYATEDREWVFPRWSKEILTPWVEKQPDQFLESKVASPKPVALRYKTFIKAQPIANVVIVHGYGERLEKFAETAYNFHENGYNVFILDQRGFGRSDHINPESTKAIYVEHFNDYVQDLELFLGQVVQAQSSARPIYIFAHSMGGLISTHLVRKRPDLVDAVVLSAPMFRMQTRGVPRIFAEWLATAAERLGYGPSYAFGQHDPTPPDIKHAATLSQARWQYFASFISQDKEWPYALGGTSFHWLLEALRGSQQTEEKGWAESIQTPILLFQADHDTYVDNSGQDYFCEHAKDCRKILVPGTRHEIYREQDVARGPYLQTILEFYEAQTKRKQQLQMARP